MSLLTIISLTILALVLIVAFWPDDKPEMIETDKTEAAILKQLENDMTAEQANVLRGELAYVRYVAKLTKSSVDTVD